MESRQKARRAAERREGLPTGSLTPYRAWCEVCGIDLQAGHVETHNLGARHRRNTTTAALDARLEDITADKGGITVSPRNVDMATVTLGSTAVAQLAIHRPGSATAVSSGDIRLVSAAAAIRGSEEVTVTFASSGASVTDTLVAPEASIPLALSHTSRRLGHLDHIIVMKFVVREGVSVGGSSGFPLDMPHEKDYKNKADRE